MAYTSSKSQATGYSDFYKNSSNTPDDSNNSDLTELSDEDKRKLAIKRRLSKMRKVGS